MKKRHLLSADLIRSLAIIGVLLSHITIAVSGRPDFFNGISWWFSVILGTLSRAAIPFFILISGFFILGKNESFKTSLKRNFNRIIIPLVIWVLIYTYTLGGMSIIGALKSLPEQLYQTNVFHLYFLEIMIGLYVVSTIFALYLKNISKKSRIFLTIFFLLLGGIQALLQFIFGECDDNIFTIWVPYVGLFLAGFVFGESSIKRAKLLIFISVSFFLLTLTVNYLHAAVYFQTNVNLFSANGCISNYPNYFLSFNVMIMSIAMFIVLLKWDLKKLKNTFLEKVIVLIASCSYGIFLTHLLILQLLDSHLHLFDKIAPVWFYLLVKFIVVFLLSLGLTLIIKKIPVIRRIIGEK